LINLDPNESFWRQHVGVPFPQVAVSVKQQVDDVEAKVGKKRPVNNEDGDDDNDYETTQDLSRKLDLLPEIQMQKDNMEMHTKIAFALLDCINTRGLDVFFRIEEGIMTRSASQKKKDVLAALDGKGSPQDKLRLFLIYYVTHHNLSPAELAEFEDKLQLVGCDLTPLNYIKAIKTFDDSWATTTLASQQNPQFGNNSQSFGDWVGSFKSMFSAGIQMFVPATKDYYVTRIVDAIMEIKQDKLTADFLYFDPKFPPQATPRKNTPFREGIVFMVGGGNYLEFQNLKEYAENCSTKEGLPVSMTGTKIIYGSTEMLTGEQFLQQLHQLGEVDYKK